MKNRSNGFIFNSLLFYGVGLVPAILICTSLKTGVFFGAMLFVSLLLSNFLVSFFGGLIKRGIRIPCFMLISFASVYLVDGFVYLISPNSYSTLSPLIAMIMLSTLLMFRAEEGGFKSYRIKDALWDAVSHGLVFVIAVMSIGFIRELFAYGTIWEVQTAWSGFSTGFDSTIGGIFITLCVAFIYNTITVPLRKKKITFDSLVAKYETHIEKRMKDMSPTGEEVEVGR